MVGIFSSFILISGLVTSGKACAQPNVEVTQSLNFGSVITRDNLAAYTLTITAPNDSVNIVGGGLIPLMDVTPRNGVLEADGFDPGVEVTVTFDPTEVELSCNCGSPSFYVDNFTTVPSGAITIQPDGTAVIPFGARLRTTGSGIRYSGDTYTGEVEISVMFDEI